MGEVLVAPLPRYDMGVRQVLGGDVEKVRLVARVLPSHFDGSVGNNRLVICRLRCYDGSLLLVFVVHVPLRDIVVRMVRKEDV